jgi:hypothetical protein
MYCIFFPQRCDGLLVMCLPESSAAARIPLSSSLLPSLLTDPALCAVWDGLTLQLGAPFIACVCRDVWLENKSVQCWLPFFGLLGAIKGGREQIRFFFFFFFLQISPSQGAPFLFSPLLRLHVSSQTPFDLLLRYQIWMFMAGNCQANVQCNKDYYCTVYLVLYAAWWWSYGRNMLWQ